MFRGRISRDVAPIVFAYDGKVVDCVFYGKKMFGIVAIFQKSNAAVILQIDISATV